MHAYSLANYTSDSGVLFASDLGLTTFIRFFIAFSTLCAGVFGETWWNAITQKRAASEMGVPSDVMSRVNGRPNFWVHRLSMLLIHIRSAWSCLVRRAPN